MIAGQIRANYITTDEFFAFNPDVDSSTAVATISGIITRASAYVDNFLQYTLPVETIIGEQNEASVSTDGNLKVFTLKKPIISISAISLKSGEYDLDLPLLNPSGNPLYDISFRKNCVVCSSQSLYQVRGYSHYSKITYTAGYLVIPDDIKDAVGLIAKDIYNRASNPLGAQSMSQGGISVSFSKSNRFESRAKSANLELAEEILSSYQRITA